MNHIFRIATVVLVCLCVILPAGAEQTDAAENISSFHLIADAGGIATWCLFDGLEIVAAKAEESSYITLEDERGFGSLYLIFDLEYGEYTLTNNNTGEVLNLGQKNLLHDFIPLEGNPTSVTLTFSHGKVKLNEIYAFTQGKVPGFVQMWEEPHNGETDLVLFSTHGDDEHLFFAGILPYYAAERGYQVQVVYLTDHRNLTTRRCHEMLDGLWAVGVRTYPVFGSFHDYFSASKEQAYGYLEKRGFTEEMLLSYVVEQIRRFKPKVAVCHDPVKGEYGHGAHMLYADLLMKSLEISNDPEQFPESAENYGTWDVPKTYLHCYSENPIVMDWDQPLESFGGMTAFEVSAKLGFVCHESQYSDFAWYIAGKKTAAQIKQFGPRDFGLYRSTVGEDVQKNDFFENLTSYAQDEAIRQEQARLEALQLEAQRKAQEEADRMADEEEKARLEEQAHQEALQARKEQIKKSEKVSVMVVFGLVLLVIPSGIYFIKNNKK